MTRVSPSRASRSSAGTSSATELRSASSSCWTSSSGTSDSARGTSSVVQSTISGVGCTSTVALNVQGSLSLAGSSKSYSGVATGRSRDRAAAFQNHPPMCDSTASTQSRSRPTFASSTWRGTLPLRNPGILTDPARSSAACSTACSSSCGETSTVRRTRLPPSSSTWAMSLIQAAWVKLAAGCGLTPERRVSPNGVRLQSDTCSAAWPALRSDRPRAWRNWQTRRV